MKGGQKDWGRCCDLLRERSSCHFGIRKSQRLRASKLKRLRPPSVYNPLPAHRPRVGSQARMDLPNTTSVYTVILVGTALLTPDWYQTTTISSNGSGLDLQAFWWQNQINGASTSSSIDSIKQDITLSRSFNTSIIYMLDVATVNTSKFCHIV